MESVLIVDFLKETLTITENILKPDFTVLTAQTPQDAAEIIAESKPDIVLINYIVPGSNGVNVLKELSKRKKNFLAIMMTNVKDMEVVVDAISHGFDGFVKIPVELERFELQLKRARDIYQMRIDASNYTKVKATKAMSITFSHYTRNLLTPPIGYLSTIKELLPEAVYNVFDNNLNKINELTYKLDDLLEKGELNETSYADETEFYNLMLDEEKKES
jgi:response regulator RpfG family c-di-GMP phosphodiesterase